MDVLLDLLQWPAMVITLLAAWLVGAQKPRKRAFGFWLFVASNLMWAVWGWHTSAWALIALQAGLFLMNLRGIRKNERADNEEPAPTSTPH